MQRLMPSPASSQYIAAGQSSSRSHTKRFSSCSAGASLGQPGGGRQIRDRAGGQRQRRCRRGLGQQQQRRVVGLGHVIVVGMNRRTDNDLERAAPVTSSPKNTSNPPRRKFGGTQWAAVNTTRGATIVHVQLMVAGASHCRRRATTPTTAGSVPALGVPLTTGWRRLVCRSPLSTQPAASTTATATMVWHERVNPTRVGQRGIV